MKCEMPFCSGVSRREPLPTQTPAETERTYDIASVIMRRPFGSVVVWMSLSACAADWTVRLDDNVYKPDSFVPFWRNRKLPDAVLAPPRGDLFVFHRIRRRERLVLVKLGRFRLLPRHFAKRWNNAACSVEVLRISFFAFSMGIVRTTGSLQGGTLGTGGVRVTLVSFSMGNSLLFDTIAVEAIADRPNQLPCLRPC